MITHLNYPQTATSRYVVTFWSGLGQLVSAYFDTNDEAFGFQRWASSNGGSTSCLPVMGR